MILVLVCVLLTLQYLHGEHYIQCDCIFPDEILDLPCSTYPVFADEERDICFEIEDIKHFKITDKISISSMLFYNKCMAKNHFGLEWPTMQSFKKRLFLLRHFNS